jgi:hypothetical protein
VRRGDQPHKWADETDSGGHTAFCDFNRGATRAVRRRWHTLGTARAVPNPDRRPRPRFGTSGSSDVVRLPVDQRSSHEALATRSGATGSCVLAVSCGCFIAAPIARARRPASVIGINTHVRRSRRQPRRPAIWTSLVLSIAQEPSRRPEPSCSQIYNRKRASVCQRRSMPKRSGAAEGVGDGRLPLPVQVDHSRRRGPFSGL